MHNKINQIIVKSLVYNDIGQVLILESKWGYWDLPGGRLEYGESPEETLLREVKEETDMVVEIENLHTIQTVILDRLHRNPPEMIHYSSLIYISKFLNNKEAINVSKDDEIVGFKWLSPTQIINDSNMKLLPFNRDLLEDLERDNPVSSKKKYFIKEGEFDTYKEINNE